MANYLERYILLRDATLDPDAPGFSPPSDTTLANVQAARTLVRRIESALIDLATAELAKPLPENVEQPQREALYWAHSTLGNPAGEARRMLQILLARFPNQSPAEILDPAGVATDSNLKTKIGEIAKALAFAQAGARR